MKKHILFFIRAIYCVSFIVIFYVISQTPDNYSEHTNRYLPGKWFPTDSKIAYEFNRDGSGCKIDIGTNKRRPIYWFWSKFHIAIYYRKNGFAPDEQWYFDLNDDGSTLVLRSDISLEASSDINHYVRND